MGDWRISASRLSHGFLLSFLQSGSSDSPELRRQPTLLLYVVIDRDNPAQTDPFSTMASLRFGSRLTARGEPDHKRFSGTLFSME